MSRAAPDNLQFKCKPRITVFINRVHHVCSATPRSFKVSPIKTPRAAKGQRKHRIQYQFPKNHEDGFRHSHTEYTGREGSGDG